jgi:hypothetical protein
LHPQPLHFLTCPASAEMISIYNQSLFIKPINLCPAESVFIFLSM